MHIFIIFSPTDLFIFVQVLLTHTQSHKFYLSSRQHFYWRRNAVNQALFFKHENIFNIITCLIASDRILEKAQALALPP